MNKKKKWIITAIVLVVFCLILGLYNLLNDKAPASDDAAKAPIAPRRQSTLNVNGRIVRPQRLTDGITTVGNLLPDEEVDLSFETSGKIVAINFLEGTVVRKGELWPRSTTCRSWPSSRVTRRSSNWPKTAFTVRAPCSKRTP